MLDLSIYRLKLVILRNFKVSSLEKVALFPQILNEWYDYKFRQGKYGTLRQNA